MTVIEMDGGAPREFIRRNDLIRKDVEMPRHCKTLYPSRVYSGSRTIRRKRVSQYFRMLLRDFVPGNNKSASISSGLFADLFHASGPLADERVGGRSLARWLLDIEPRVFRSFAVMKIASGISRDARQRSAAGRKPGSNHRNGPGEGTKAAFPLPMLPCARVN